DTLRPVSADASGRSPAGLSFLVPSVERRGRAPPAFEHLDRVEQRRILRRRGEMFRGQLETEVPRETSCFVTASPRVEWFALVVGIIEHRDREFGVVGPRAPIHVVGTD